MLAYPALDKAFVVETDASIIGLRAVMSQSQDDELCHPVAFASRSSTAAELNYGITELDRLQPSHPSQLLSVTSLHF